jgi:hypothetical protein
MHNQNTTRRFQLVTRRASITPAPTRCYRPGDKVLIFDGLVSQNIWIVVDEILFTNGRTKIRSGNMDFFFDASLVISHRKGGRS